MSFKRTRIVHWVMTTMAIGTIFQFQGCSLSGLQNFAQTINPCGTVLECNPLQYRFLTSGYEGPGVDPDVDPACTYPPFCGATDPFTGGIVP